MNLEDLLQPKSNIEKKLNEFYKTATPEQVVKELEELGAEFESIAPIPDYAIDDPEIVGYPDIEFQEEIYTWTVENNWSDVNVLDVGCGRGDLMNLDGYIGIDSNQFIIDAGKSKYPDKKLYNISFEDYQPNNITFDSIYFIGTLNVDYGKFNVNEFWSRYEYLGKLIDIGLEIGNKLIFILLHNADEGFVSFPMQNVIELLSRKNLPFKLDYSKFKDIYKLVVYKP